MGECSFIAELLLLPLAFSFWHPPYMHATLPWLRGAWSSGFLFPCSCLLFAHWSGSVHFHVLSLRNAFLSHTQFTKEPTKSILHSVTVTLTLVFPYNFFMEFLSFCLHYPSIITCLCFYIKTFSIVIILFLKLTISSF